MDLLYQLCRVREVKELDSSSNGLCPSQVTGLFGKSPISLEVRASVLCAESHGFEPRMGHFTMFLISRIRETRHRFIWRMKVLHVCYTIEAASDGKQSIQLLPRKRKE